MQIGGNGIGRKALLNGRNRLAKVEASASMSHIEDDAALASLKQIGQQTAIFIQHRNDGDTGACKYRRAADASGRVVETGAPDETWRNRPSRGYWPIYPPRLL